MVFIEPGLAEQIGTAGIDKLVAGISHVINPDYQFQEAMKVQLATNPKLAQELSDLETSAPGTLKSLGFGPLTKVLTSIPESAAGQVAREAKPEIVAGQKAEIQAKSAEAQFKGKSFADTLAAIKGDDPASVQLRHELITRMATGTISPEEDIALRKAQAQEQEARSKLLTAELPGELAKAQLVNTQLEQTIKDYPELAKYDVVNIARDMMRGKLPPKFTEFLNIPGAQQAMSHAQFLVNAQANRDEREYLRSLARGQRDPEEVANISAARTELLRTKVGTLQAWRSVLETPETVDQIKAKPFSTLTQDEKDILHVAEARQQEIDQMEDRQRRQDTTELRQTAGFAEIQAGKATSDAGRNLALGPLNKHLADVGSPYQAKFGPRPAVGETTPGFGTKHPVIGGLGVFSEGTGLYYTDRNTGKRVEDDAPFSAVSAPTLPKEVAPTSVPTSPKQVAPDVDRAVKQINSAPDKKKAMDALRTQNPQLYVKVQPYINP